MPTEKKAMANLREKTAGLLEWPRDLLLDLPRITLHGNLQCSIENHQGLLHYRPEEIVVLGGSDMNISIRGRELMIGVIYEEEITLIGHIDSIVLERKKK